MTDVATGAHPDIFWYIVFDTNWLLTQPPLPTDRTHFPARRIEGNKWQVFAVRYLLPLQVKNELTGLKAQEHDHQQIANARRWLTQLFALINKPWEKSRIIEDRFGALERLDRTPNIHHDEQYFGTVRGLPLVSCAEVDIQHLPQFKTEEGGLCADSMIDRQIVSLARIIASPPLSKNCFIATLDTGIQAEVASLFYKRGLSIGCPPTLLDFTHKWDETYSKLA